MNSTRLSVFCDKVLEIGWLLAVIVTPLFFNVYSSRVFEPDKLTTLRTIAVIMAAVWCVKLTEDWLSGRRDFGVTWRTPLLLPTLFTVIVYLVSTVFSVTPRVSFFGSYQRLQGTFTTLSYIVVFLILLQGLRTREQVDRLVGVIILNSLPIAVYGLVQHNGADPLPWGGDVTKRVASNMGNAIFVAAYLIMVAPLTLTRIVTTFRSILTDRQSGTGDVLRAAAYIFILLAQLITIYFSASRGPMLGLLGGLGIWAILGTLLLQRTTAQGEPVVTPFLTRPWMRWVWHGLAMVAAGGLVAAGIVLPGSNRVLSYSLVTVGSLLGAIVVWGVLSSVVKGTILARTHAVGDLVTDVGRALAFLALSAAAAAIAAIPLFYGSRSLLAVMSGPGRSLVWYGAAAAALLLAMGVWLATTGRSVGWWLAGLTGILLVLVAVAFLARGQSNASQLIAVGGGLLATLATWLLFIVNRWGWRWLWISCLVMAMLGGGLFLAINPGGPLHEWARRQETVRRYTYVLDAEEGTARVRSLIWEGALDLVLPHEPIQFPPTAEYPQGRLDPLNWLRPLIGYGPESMYVAYNSFYPPLLGHYESRTASPDRSHNETMDSLVITGALGLIAYVCLFGSALYFGVKGLGFLDTRRHQVLFVALLALGVAATALLIVLTIGPYFLGLSVPVGLVAALLVYLGVSGIAPYWEGQREGRANPRSILLIGLLATVVAHLIEINFGIAIAATRTTFWALAGVLVIVGMGPIGAGPQASSPQEVVTASSAGTSGGSKPARRRRRKRQMRPSEPASADAPFLGSLGTVLALGVVGGFILGTLSFDFVTNAEHLRDPAAIVARALTSLPAQDGRSSYGALLIFAVTWLMSALLLVPRGAGREPADGDPTGPPGRDVALKAIVYLIASLLIGCAFALVLANRQVSFLVDPTTLDEVVAISDKIAGLLTVYYGFVLFSLIAGGGAMMIGAARRRQRLMHPWGAIVLVVLAVAAGAVVVLYNLRPIQADIIYKQADPYDRQGQWAVSVAQYDRALELAPQEDFYLLYLGRALLEQATAIQDPATRDDVMRDTERVLIHARETNPLNTDHSANLARMYRRWAGLTSDEAMREALLELSSRNYAIATSLSPNNALLWNEWSLLAYWDRRDFAAYERAHVRSLEIDAEYVQTWLICGDVSRDQGDLDQAVACYDQALALEPDEAQVWRVLADTLIAQQDWQAAIAALTKVVDLESADKAADIWNVHHVLSQLYSRVGAQERALEEAFLAVQLAPQDQITIVQSWLSQLEALGASQE